MTEATMASNAPQTKPAPASTPAKAPAANVTAFETTRVAVDRLRPSPLNPRKQFDEEKIAAIAESIFTEGIIQNLVVRRKTGTNDLEIVAGETRYRAVQKLLKEKRVDAGYMVPVTIRTLTDEQVVELALIENMSRKDLTPMEEARALAVLRDKHKLSTEKIAERIGYTQRYVQERLRMLENLVPDAMKMMESGELKVEMARALAAAPKAMQVSLLDAITYHDIETADDIRKAIREELVPVEYAIFDTKLYKGDYVEGDKPGQRFFGDPEQFEKLQDAAIEQLAKTLKADGAAWVEETTFFHDFEYKKDAKNPKAGAVIECRNGKVTVHKGLVKAGGAMTRHTSNAPAANAGTKKKADPDDAYMTSHRVWAHVRKTFALQNAMIDQPVHAARMVCATLLIDGRFEPCNLFAPEGRFGADRRRHFKDHEGDTASPQLQAALAKLLDGCPGVKVSKRVGFETADASKAVAVWEWLVKQTPERINKLFAALIADQIGTWADDFKPGLDDPEETVAVATTLGITGQEEKHGLTLQPQDLDGLRKPALVGIRRVLGAEEEGKDSAAAVKDRIVGMAAAKSYVLPTLRFSADNKKETDALVKGTPPAKPAAKATAPKPKAKPKAKAKAKPKKAARK